jgi:predicted ATPase
MQTLIVEGVRAFKDRAEVPLRKVTLLIGENSTGKSTLMACIRLAWDIAARGEADFNEAPFELGTYDSIAHFHGGRGKRSREFTIGGEFRMAGARRRQLSHPSGKASAFPESFSVLGAFVSDRGSPVLDRWLATDRDLSIDVGRRGGSSQVTVRQGSMPPIEASLDSPPGAPLPYILRAIPGRLDVKDPGQHELMRAAVGLLYHLERAPRPYALAPVRSRPLRTYDPIRNSPNPEGEHIPALLARLRAQGGQEWDHLKRALDQFGKTSGLFSSVSVRVLGKGDGGQPFQVQLEVPGQRGPRNLLDVGYGVSQVLPIVVESALSRKGQMFLVQQPEVHLHPRAQAALGTYFADVAAAGAARFVVETHSDFIVDRVSMAVRDPNSPLTKDDVSLLFFKAHAAGVRIHTLELDEQGQIIDPPGGYRSFFLKEQASYLGLTD